MISQNAPPCNATNASMATLLMTTDVKPANVNQKKISAVSLRIPANLAALKKFKFVAFSLTTRRVNVKHLFSSVAITTVTISRQEKLVRLDAWCRQPLTTMD